jgi:excisionase family DNA binding protein
MDADVPNPRGLGPLLLSVNQVAWRVGICRAKVYAHLAAGDLQAVKIGRRTAITREEVDAFIARLPVARFRKPAGERK